MSNYFELLKLLQLLVGSGVLVVSTFFIIILIISAFREWR